MMASKIYPRKPSKFKTWWANWRRTRFFLIGTALREPWPPQKRKQEIGHE